MPKEVYDFKVFFNLFNLGFQFQDFWEICQFPNFLGSIDFQIFLVCACECVCFSFLCFSSVCFSSTLSMYLSLLLCIVFRMFLGKDC